MRCPKILIEAFFEIFQVACAIYGHGLNAYYTNYKINAIDLSPKGKLYCWSHTPDILIRTTSLRLFLSISSVDSE